MKRNINWRWERAYRSHVLWDVRGRRLGRIRLVSGPQRGYAWRTAGAVGIAGSLQEARQWVESAVQQNVRQYDLFDALDPQREFVDPSGQYSKLALN
ncbi:MAG: hypothetical protein EPN74_02090 [Rhodanobacter sp.]|nr:MAG: hypothetical protein EPN74_02090 [Rhodanobacter sp.]